MLTGKVSLSSHPGFALQLWHTKLLLSWRCLSKIATFEHLTKPQALLTFDLEKLLPSCKSLRHKKGAAACKNDLAMPMYSTRTHKQTQSSRLEVVYGYRFRNDFSWEWEGELGGRGGGPPGCSATPALSWLCNQPTIWATDRVCHATEYMQ